MLRMKLHADVEPLSAFRARTAQFIERIKQTHRPMLLTQNGIGSIVVMNAEDYDGLMEKIMLLEEVRDAEREIENGRTRSHKEAKKTVVSRLSKR